MLDFSSTYAKLNYFLIKNHYGIMPINQEDYYRFPIGIKLFGLFAGATGLQTMPQFFLLLQARHGSQTRASGYNQPRLRELSGRKKDIYYKISSGFSKTTSTKIRKSRWFSLAVFLVFSGVPGYAGEQVLLNIELAE